MNIININRKEIRTMFLGEEMSVLDISKHYNISYDECKSVLRYFDITIPKNQEKNPQNNVNQLQIVLNKISTELNVEVNLLNEVFNKYSIRIPKFVMENLYPEYKIMVSHDSINYEELNINKQEKIVVA